MGIQFPPVSAIGSGPPSPLLGGAPAAAPYTTEEMLAFVHRQQSQVSSFLGSVGQGSSGGGDLFASPTSEGLPNFADPTGDAIDYLLNSTGGGGGAGNVFSLALTANSQGRELAQIPGAVAAQAQSAYQEATALAQLVEDAKQANATALFQIGSVSASLGLSALI